MNKLSKEKRDKILLVSAGTLLVTGAIWFLLIRPLGSNLDQLRRKVTESRIQVQRGQRTVAETMKVAATLEAASVRLKSAEGAMAAGDLYAWAIQTINQFKLPYNVDIPQISREMPCEVGVFPQFPYKAATFILRGTAFYHDIGKFVAAFENTFPYVRVQNLEMEPAPILKSEENERLQFKLELVALIKPVLP